MTIYDVILIISHKDVLNWISVTLLGLPISAITHFARGVHIKRKKNYIDSSDNQTEASTFLRFFF
jgi:hypothetical protein